MKEKNKWIAAILNFLIYGLGYLYAGKRTAFGWFLLIADIILMYSMITHKLIFSLSFNLACLILSIAFAYDIYYELK